MKANKAKITIVSILVAVLMLSSGLCVAAEKIVRYSVGRVGGTYYVMGSGLAEIIKKHVPGYTVELTTATGSVEDVRLVESKQVEMSQGPATTLYDAREGVRSFKKEGKYKNLRHVLQMHANTWSPIVRKESSIQKFTDIKGKFVAIPSSGHLVIFRDYLNAYKMKIEDLKWQYIPYTKAATALQDRKVDLFFLHAGIPVAAADELAHKIAIRILPLDKWAADNLIKEKPFYNLGKVPAGTYPGIEKDVPAGQIFTTVIVHKDADPDFVYQMCKAFYANLDYMKTVHPAAKQIRLEDALVGQVWPLHPGAERYYKEVGMVK